MQHFLETDIKILSAFSCKGVTQSKISRSAVSKLMLNIDSDQKLPVVTPASKLPLWSSPIAFASYRCSPAPQITRQFRLLLHWVLSKSCANSLSRGLSFLSLAGDEYISSPASYRLSLKSAILNEN